MNTSSQHDTLFLHGGPGFNAHVERLVLSTRFPNVHFWDQPPVHTAQNAFDLLMDAVVAEVNRMADDLPGPIKLMANSFAAHLVSDLLKHIPQMISSCHIFGAVYDTPAAYLNLLRVMAKYSGAECDQTRRIKEFVREQENRPADKNKIWDYLSLIASDVEFMRYYWPIGRQYAAWSNLTRSGPQFDFATLQNVVNDQLKHHSETDFSYTGPQDITIELGNKDPLLDLENEMRLWGRIFPNAEIIVRRGSGHFIHLEPYL